MLDSGRAEAEILGGLDGIAHMLLQRVAPIRFDIASNDSDRRAIFQLRYRTVVEEGWVAPEAYPDGLERDAFDDAATHIAGWKDAELVAAARLVLPQSGRRLPTETEFELYVAPEGEVVDIGRAIVAREYRSSEHAVFGALLSRCWLHVRAQGYHHLCGAATHLRLERYRQFGLPLRILGPARGYWGEERYPVFLDGVEFGKFALAAATRFLGFI